jgi:hypothetical protein
LSKDDVLFASTISAGYKSTQNEAKAVVVQPLLPSKCLHGLMAYLSYIIISLTLTIVTIITVSFSSTVTYPPMAVALASEGSFSVGIALAAVSISIIGNSPGVSVVVFHLL